MEKRGAKSLTSGLDTLNEIVRALDLLGIEFTNGDAIGVRLNYEGIKGKEIEVCSYSSGILPPLRRTFGGCR